MRQRVTTLCCALRFRSILSRPTSSRFKTSHLAVLALLGATTALMPFVTLQSRALAQETAPPAQAPAAAPSAAPSPLTPAAPVQPVPERPAPSPAPAQAVPPPPPAAQTSPPAKTTDEAVIDAPAIPYRSVPNFLKLPRDMHMGEASGVAVNSQGHIFVFVRGGSSVGPAYGNTASQLWEFDRNGRFLREIGKNLYAWAFAHTVRVDKDDNIWATDKGSDMVVKFNPQGQVQMVFGRKSEAADEHAKPWAHPKPPAPPIDGRFRQPTDVTWDKAGNIYVSDGYINSRVAKYDKNGNWVKSWGTHGKGPGQFDLVHAIASDADGNIYVADRNNRRIQVFDGDGNLKRIIQINVAFPDSARPAIGNKPNLKDYLKSGGSQTPGAPWTLCITPPPHQVLYTSDSFPGRIYKLSLDGKVLGVLGQSGKQLGQFGWVHEIACPSENTLYVAEILNWRVQKLLLNNASDTSGDTAAPSDRRERRMERREERREQRHRNRYRE